jgi:hypothetical protein
MDGLLKTAIKKMLLMQVCLLGVLILVSIAFSRGLLSPRELGIAMVILFIAIFISLRLIRKKLAKQIAEPAIALDDDTRRRILRGIWMRKVWIGVLALLLLVGIANGVANRAWLPTLAGVGMNLLWMYVTAHEIRRLRERINVTRE